MNKVLTALAIPVVVLIVLICFLDQSDKPVTVEVAGTPVEEVGIPEPVANRVADVELAPSLDGSPTELIEPEVAPKMNPSVEVSEISDREAPQGRPVVDVPADQVLDDPREYGGVIIPRSNRGVYVPGLKAEMSISSAKKSGELTPNQEGAFPTVVIIPNGEATITLSYPELSEGSLVKLYCPDGGTIDGEASATRILDGTGRLSFQWEGNSNLGRHTVHCFAGPNDDEKVISFWVGPRAYADASSVPRS